MKKGRTTQISLAEDGSVVLRSPEGEIRDVKGQTDWDRVAAMTDDEVRRAAESDPDAQPLTARQLTEACCIPEKIDVRAIRLRRKMSQAAFARRYGLALNALQDWEQGRRPPGRCARILLTIIDKEPEAVERALAG